MSARDTVGLFLGLQDEQSPASSEFEKDLAAYLSELQLPAACREHAQHLCVMHDFSSARATLIASVPGKHAGG